MQNSKYILLIMLSSLLCNLPACTIVRDHFGKQAKASNTITANENLKINNKGKNRDAEQQLEKELLQAAKSIEKSLGTLAAAQDYKNPPLVNTAPLVTRDGGLGHTADVDWTGPVSQLLAKIAENSNYRFKVLGKEPAIPVLVSINAKQAVMADIIQNASLQVGRRAQIMVFAKEHVIELRYLNPT